MVEKVSYEEKFSQILSVSLFSLLKVSSAPVSGWTSGDDADAIMQVPAKAMKSDKSVIQVSNVVIGEYWNTP